MSLSKKMREILAGFYAVMERYEKAFESGDSAAALQFGGEVVKYCEKYQKDLKFSDETLAEMKKRFTRLCESTAKEAILEAELKETRARRKILEQEYLKALTKDKKDKKIKWN